MKDFKVQDFFNAWTLGRMTPAKTGKSTQRYLRKLYKKDVNFRGKVAWFGHLDARATRRGEVDL